MIKNRICLLLFCLLFLCLVSSGCQGQPISAAGIDAEETETITLMASRNWIRDVDLELFHKYKEETGITVKVLTPPDHGYDSLLISSLSGGTTSIDMFMFHSGSVARSAGIPAIALDLSGEPWVKNLEEWARITNTHDGKLLGFSTWGIDYEGILYNKSFFEENGLTVPDTWEGFLSLCEQIKALGKYPLYESINSNWHTQEWFYAATPILNRENPNFIHQLNLSVDNTFAELSGIKPALEQIRALMADTSLYTHEDTADDWLGSYRALKNREAVMMASYSAIASELVDDYGSEDEWGMFPIPLCDNTIAVSNGGGPSKYINKSSQHIDACLDFLNFMARPENLELYYESRTDLVSAAFQNVNAAKPTSATTEILERSTQTPQTMMMKELLYWDPNIYQYMQGFANDTLSVDEFIAHIDQYRASMLASDSGTPFKRLY